MGILDHPSSSGSSQSTHNNLHRGTPTSSGPVASTGTGYFGVDWAKWFPPLTSRTLLSHYLPASGAVSHTLYTVHLFSPNIMSSFFPTADLAVSNTILFNANVGLGFYVYFRRHLHRVNPWERVEFSVLSSTIFNFGSLLAAVLIKALFPARSPTWLKSLTATVLSGYLLSRATKYMQLLDHRTSGRSSVSPARSVLSPPRHMPISNNNNAGNGLRQKTSSDFRRLSSSSTTSTQFASSPAAPLHLDTSETMASSSSSAFSSTILETPPRSLEQHQQHYQPMTPSATEASASEFGTSEELTTTTSAGNLNAQNYRYLHSYALNNIANHSHQKRDAILRRTTMNQKTSSTNGIQKMFSTPQKTPDSAPLCFVTPEPSLREQEGVYETPPPSRLESRRRQRNQKSEHRRRAKNEVDELDRILDLVIDHAPLALVPLAVGCWWTGSVPIVGSTLRFIFA